MGKIEAGVFADGGGVGRSGASSTVGLTRHTHSHRIDPGAICELLGRPAHTRHAATFARRLRREMTMEEATVWAAISKRQLGIRFRRQVPIGEWIVDFACLDPKLVIEIDGSVHDFRDETTRTAYIESLGFTVLRLDNDEVADQYTDFTKTIVHWIESIRLGVDPEAT